MSKSLNWPIVFLSLFVFSSLVPVAYAADANKAEAKKAVAKKAEPAKAVQQAKPGEARHGDARPGEVRPGEVRPGAVRPGEVRPGEVRRGEARPGEVRREEARRGEIRNIDRHREIRSRAEIHRFVGRDYRHWNERERAIWRDGVWRQEEYMGRVGYWWIAGGQRYFYEQPVYPYPLVVAPVMYELPVAVEQPVIVQPPVVYERPAPRFQPQTVQSWYYCDNPPGYSPYITSCASGWRAVPAQMASPPPPQAPPAPFTPPPQPQAYPDPGAQ